MSDPRLISAEEGAKLAGVSIETIRQYEKYGLLKAERFNEISYYLKTELCDVFNIIAQPDNTPPETMQTKLEEAITEKVMIEEIPPENAIRQVHDAELSSYDLVGSNKTLREQIEILKSERDWLRTRLEKLEERTERDQMLLLSETQTVRKLIQTGLEPTKSEKGIASWLRAIPFFRKD
jgi:hypothetical protein